jgi:hypothetical protein
MFQGPRSAQARHPSHARWLQIQAERSFGDKPEQGVRVKLVETFASWSGVLIGGLVPLSAAEVAEQSELLQQELQLFLQGNGLRSLMVAAHSSFAQLLCGS